MKALSILFTLALLIGANRLAAHLEHIHALPVRSQAENSISQTTDFHQ